MGFPNQIPIKRRTLALVLSCWLHFLFMMNAPSNIRPLDTRLVTIVESFDLIVQNFVRAVASLSNYLLGILLIVLLLPLAMAVLPVLFVVSRVSLELFAREVQKAFAKIGDMSDEELMELHIVIEDLQTIMTKAVPDSHSTKQYYDQIFFGSSLRKVNSRLALLANIIEGKVYPDIQKPPTTEQLLRLARVFQGVEHD